MRKTNNLMFTGIFVAIAISTGGLGYLIKSKELSNFESRIVMATGNEHEQGSGDTPTPSEPVNPPDGFEVSKIDEPYTQLNASLNLDFRTSDPITFDPFEEYGKDELAKIATTAKNWDVMKNYRISSYYFKGEPDTADHLVTNANGKITYDVNKNISELPLNVKRVIKVFDETKWEELVPARNAIYTYTGFLKAVHKYPRFCAEKNDEITELKAQTLDDVCKAEISNMFAHFAQEVGGHDSNNTGELVSNSWPFTFANPLAVWPKEQWKQGLVHVEEVGWTADRRIQRDGTLNVGYRQCGADSVVGDLAFPCFPDQSYHGRGAKQLSYNYNYAPFSRVMYGPDYAEVLTQNPDKVSTEGWLALSSAMYFYMTPRKPKPSIHDTVVGRWIPSEGDITAERKKGFGVAINIINGGIECGGSAEVAQAKNRKNYFIEISKWFGFYTGWYDRSDYKNDCKNMKAFDDSGSTFYEPSWGQDYINSTDCQLLSYEEGPYTPLMPGDYYRCVQALKMSKKEFKHADYRAGKNVVYTKIKDLKDSEKPYSNHNIENYVVPNTQSPSNGGSGSGSENNGADPLTISKKAIIVDNTVLTDAMLNLAEEQKKIQYGQQDLVCRKNSLTWNKLTGRLADCLDASGKIVPSWDSRWVYPAQGKRIGVGDLIIYYESKWYRNKRMLAGGEALNKWGGYEPSNPTQFEEIKRSN